MDGSTGRARTVEAGVSPGAVASLAAMSIAEVFRRITTAFEQAGIRYMLTGSFAGAHYGVPRSTQDIDFVVEQHPRSCKRSSSRYPPQSIIPTSTLL